MNWDKPHTFSKDEAADRLRALTDYWNTKSGVECSWQGSDSVAIKGNVKGVKFEATLTVLDSKISAVVKANLIAKKVGKAYVEKKINQYLDPATALDALPRS